MCCTVALLAVLVLEIRSYGHLSLARCCCFNAIVGHARPRLLAIISRACGIELFRLVRSKPDYVRWWTLYFPTTATPLRCHLAERRQIGCWVIKLKSTQTSRTIPTFATKMLTATSRKSSRESCSGNWT